jgi:multidrug efflux pump subunit AcrA (membrane-fusion protein)
MKPAGVLVVVCAVAAAAWWGSSCRRDAGGGGEEHSTVVVRTGDLRVPVHASGSIVWGRVAPVRAAIAGRIDEIRVAEGQVVRKGDVVAVVSPLQRALIMDAVDADEKVGRSDSFKFRDAYAPLAITAPSAGVVADLPVIPGVLVAGDTVLMAIADAPTARIFVEESDIRWIAPDGECVVGIDALPGVMLTGKVTRVGSGSVARRSAVCYPVDVGAIVLPPGARVGMTLSGTFRGEERKGVMVIPAAAVFESNGRAAVRRRAGGGAYEDLEIRAGLTDGSAVEVLEGLKVGDLVAADAASAVSASRMAKRRSPFLPFTSAP